MNYDLILAVTLAAIGGVGLIVGWLLRGRREPDTYAVQPPDPYTESLRGNH